MTFPWILAALAALAAVYIIFAIVVAKMIADLSGEAEFWPAFGIGLAYGLVPGLNIATFVAMKMADRDEKARSRCA